MAGCGPSVRGLDCGFDGGLFSTVTAIMWLLTSLPLLAWAMPRLRKGWKASRAARASLLLAATSALMSSADEFLYLRIGKHVSFHDPDYGNKTLMAVGSILLAFAMCAFSHVWCDVASALGKLHKQGSYGEGVISVIKLSYKVLALLHVPFALMFAVHDYAFVGGQSYFLVVSRVWAAWLLIGMCIGLTGLAAIQYYVASSCLRDVDAARSLWRTAAINLVEQVAFDVGLIVYVVLYQADSYYNGKIIAAHYSVYFILYWAMHVQVVLFFAIMGPTDPLYSQGDLDALLCKVVDTEQQDGPKVDDVAPTAFGSPQHARKEVTESA